MDSIATWNPVPLRAIPAPRSMPWTTSFSINKIDSQPSYRAKIPVQFNKNYYKVGPQATIIVLNMLKKRTYQ